MMINKRPFINWKIVFTSLIVIAIIIAIIYVVQTYERIVSSKLTDEQKISEIILEETDVISIVDMVEFQSSDTVYIATGATKDKEKKLVFVKEKSKDAKQLVQQYNDADLYTETDIIAHWKNNCGGCEFKKTQLAMIDEEPLREITYVDKYNRYVFAYYSLEDGSLYEEMKLSRKYQ